MVSMVFIFFVFCESKIDHVTLQMMDGINSPRTTTCVRTQQSGANRIQHQNELFSSKHGWCSISFIFLLVPLPFSLHIFCVKATEKMSNDGQHSTECFKINDTYLFGTLYVEYLSFKMLLLHCTMTIKFWTDTKSLAPNKTTEQAISNKCRDVNTSLIIGIPISILTQKDRYTYWSLA
jgi:hypothetical protein